MGRASYTIWQEQQWKQIKRIYLMVLKHGWKIEKTRITQHGVHCFTMSGPNEIYGSWEEIQFHELTSRQELARLPSPPENGDWELRDG